MGNERYDLKKCYIVVAPITHTAAHSQLASQPATSNTPNWVGCNSHRAVRTALTLSPGPMMWSVRQEGYGHARITCTAQLYIS
ncbi:hypothetical protein E2C01_060190 [Portunus trituberculatus]|uniref:Uncharacterized protein n=1 Tax=Portunus trituberculatus TaxID=210409 RepID=A0A5B7H9S8_PORTR|nr:hypothetical protein [Portunus trituberculatus]